MIFTVVDNRMGSYPSDCVEKLLTLALKCCQEETDARPSMADVVRELESIWAKMPEAETKSTDSVMSDSGKLGTPPFSSPGMKNPYISSDVSGSNLDSEIIPTIVPR